MEKGIEGFVNQNNKDNILINVDNTALEGYKKQREFLRQSLSNSEQINTLKQEVSELKSDISEIKQLLLQSLGNK
jgi:hypothetical protein